MLVLVPIFALLLAVMHWWPRVYLIEHLVFSIHIHTVVFVGVDAGGARRRDRGRLRGSWGCGVADPGRLSLDGDVPGLRAQLVADDGEVRRGAADGLFRRSNGGLGLASCRRCREV